MGVDKTTNSPRTWCFSHYRCFSDFDYLYCLFDYEIQASPAQSARVSLVSLASMHAMTCC